VSPGSSSLAGHPQQLLRRTRTASGRKEGRRAGARPDHCWRGASVKMVSDAHKKREGRREPDSGYGVRVPPGDPSGPAAGGCWHAETTERKNRFGGGVEGDSAAVAETGRPGRGWFSADPHREEVRVDAISAWRSSAQAMFVTSGHQRRVSVGSSGGGGWDGRTGSARGARGHPTAAEARDRRRPSRTP